MTEEQKQFIDNASYRELLRLWRFEPAGSQWFTGECGEYFSMIMQLKKIAEGPAAAVAASKEVGW